MNSGRSARQLCAGQQRCIAHTLLLIVLSHYVVAACTVQPTVLHWPPLTTRDRAQTLWTEFTEFTQTHGKTYRPDEVLTITRTTPMPLAALWASTSPPT